MVVTSKRNLILSIVLLLAVVSLKAQKKNDIVVLGNPLADVYDISFFNEGSALAAATGNTVQFFNIENQKMIRQFESVHSNTILTIDVSADDTRLVSGGKDGLIVLWDTKSGEVIQKLNYHQGVVTSVKFSADARYLVSGASDNKVILYDLSSKEIKFTFTHADDILAVAFSPDGKTVASASADQSIKFWDVEVGAQIFSIDDLKSFPRSIAFSPDNTKLIACGDNSITTVWDVTDFKHIKKQEELKHHLNWLLSVDFNADNDTFVTGGISGKIKICCNLSTYGYKLGKTINKVLFQPNQGVNLKIAAATMGNGVVLIDAVNMKTKLK